MGHGKRADMIVHEDEPYNAEAPTAALAGRPLTPLDSFYSRNHGAIPTIDPSSWRLRVDGLVERELDLSLEQLQADFPEHSVVATLQCAGNRRDGFLRVRDIPDEAPWGSAATSTARWTGVRLSDVMTAAGLQRAVEHVEFLGPDLAQDARPRQPYGSSIPVQKASADEVLLAWAMNGQSLPAAHGGPVRVVVPGYIGARSVKWVQRIRGLAHESDNYFQAVAYRLPAPATTSGAAAAAHGEAIGAVLLNCDILSPAGGDLLRPGPSMVTGYALAGEGRGLARVEVSLDRGATWQEATLEDELGVWAWRLWGTRVDLPPGEVEILARAWDTAGATQPESVEQLWNPKGYGNNSWPRLHVTAGTTGPG